MKKFLDWLDDRTGYRDAMDTALNEEVPGGARWRYVWGSTLVFTFMVQVITGIFLWTAYSPSAQTAWESVYFIQHQMTLGWLVRGVHHYAAQAMVVLLAVHFLQIIIDGAYKAPREVNYWLGLILMQIVLGLALTGYLLPWDQKGYYATKVATNIMGATPFIGPQLQQLVQGGSEYGHHTLTRFFALHAGILPGLLIAFLVLHLAVFRRHGLTVPDPNRKPDAKFWPDQILKDGIACLAVLAVVLGFSIFRGVELSAPADPAEAYTAARPEWYFLFLFRFLKIEAVDEIGLAFGAIYVPGIIMTVLVLMPFIAKSKLGHKFNITFLGLLMIGVVVLTSLAIYEDKNNEEHQHAIAEAHHDAERTIELAGGPDGIPIEGAVSLLRNDPKTRGPAVYAQYCSSCHHFNGTDGDGNDMTSIARAADLGDFRKREWIEELLVNYHEKFAPLKNTLWYDEDDPEYILLHGEMADWSESNREVLTDPANKKHLNALVEFIHAQSEMRGETFDESLVELGRDVFENGTLAKGEFTSSCADCHRLKVAGTNDLMEGSEGYPDLTGYRSSEWVKSFIENPSTDQHYGANNKMPAFESQLTEQQLNLISRWLTKDYYEKESKDDDNE